MSRLQEFTQRLVTSDASLGRIGSLELNIWLAQIAGIPLTGLKLETYSQKLKIWIYGSTLLLIHFFYVCLEFYDVALIFNDMDMLTQNLAISITHCTYYFKVCNIFHHYADMKWVMEKLSLFTRTVVLSQSQLQLFYQVEMHNKLMTLFYLGIVAAPTFMGMILVITFPEGFAGKEFPYHVQMPNFLPPTVQHVYMGMSLFLISSAVTMIDSINILMMNEVCMHLKMISLAFEETSSSSTNNQLSHEKRLIQTIWYHTELIEVHRTVERIYRLPVMVQFVSSMFIIGITSFQVIVGDRGQSNSSVLSYFSLLTLLCQLFLYCWFGNEVSEQSKKLLQSGFASSWHERDTKFRKMLIIFMINAQRPFIFTAGGFMELSLQSFTYILSKSYSFVAILRQMYATK